MDYRYGKNLFDFGVSATENAQMAAIFSFHCNTLCTKASEKSRILDDATESVWYTSSLVGLRIQIISKFLLIVGLDRYVHCTELNTFQFYLFSSLFQFHICQINVACPFGLVFSCTHVSLSCLCIAAAYTAVPCVILPIHLLHKMLWFMFCYEVLVLIRLTKMKTKKISAMQSVYQLRHCMIMWVKKMMNYLSKKVSQCRI